MVVAETCSCCLDPLHATDAADAADAPIAFLVCGHAMHTHCLGQLQQNKCPLCRRRILNLSRKEEDVRTITLCVCLFGACTILPYFVYMLTLLLVSIAGLQIPTHAGLLVALLAMLGLLWQYLRALAVTAAATRVHEHTHRIHGA